MARWEPRPNVYGGESAPSSSAAQDPVPQQPAEDRHETLESENDHPNVNFRASPAPAGNSMISNSNSTSRDAPAARKTNGANRPR